MFLRLIGLIIGKVCLKLGRGLGTRVIILIITIIEMAIEVIVVVILLKKIYNKADYLTLIGRNIRNWSDFIRNKWKWI